MCTSVFGNTLGFFFGGGERGGGNMAYFVLWGKKKGKKKSDPPQPQLKTRFEFWGLHLLIF